MTIADQGKKKVSKIELLAPAGDFEALKAAVENGADAVYLGGKLFNARASAANFAGEELKKAIYYAHERLVKVYVTVNVLVADSEFPQLEDFLYELYTLGADAVIVQDIGVARFIREVLPEMKIHASTQMTVNNSYGLRQLEEMGFARVVLARETTREEIKKMAAETNLELEVFGHGALCICYSGQCLMSSYIGARSGNRGRCAQPCRLAYRLVDSKNRDLLDGLNLGDHLLSPRDLNLSDHLAEMQRLGICSLKLEGRMKRAEYVATVVRIYRKALDALQDGGPGLTDQDRYELTQIFNRDFTTGYFHGYQGAGMMSFSRPNNRGTMLGRIQEVKRGRIFLKLENTLHTGDGLEIWTGRGREGITVQKIYNSAGREVESAARGETAVIEFRGAARKGDRVFKTYDRELMAKANLSYQEGKEKRKRPLKMVLSGRIDTRLRLEAIDGEQRVAVESSSLAQKALNKPLTYDYLWQQLGRLGNTPFILAELELEIPENIILPVSEINNLRRQAVTLLLEKTHNRQDFSPVNYQEYQKRCRQWRQKIEIKSRHGAADSEKTKSPEIIKPQLTVAVSDIKSIPALVKSRADRIIIGGEHWRFRPPLKLQELQEAVDFCLGQGVDLLWRLPRIMNEEQSQKIFAQLSKISVWPRRPAVMVSNLAGIQMIRSLDPRWAWETDHYLYVFNQAALYWILSIGGQRAALSTELSKEQLPRLASPGHVEMLVFGDMEMMISEFCLLGATLGQSLTNKARSRDNSYLNNSGQRCSGICHGGEFFLQDRLAYKFPLVTDRECRMHIFNSKKLNLITELNKIAEIGLRHIRLELPRATEGQAAETVRIFKELWTEAAEGSLIDEAKTQAALHKLELLYPEGFTKGHFYRGVLA